MSAKPIWKVVAQLGASAPPQTWDNVPTDLSRDPIAQYYRDCDQRRREAEQRVADAIAAGADECEIARLKEAAHWAGYTGD